MDERGWWASKIKPKWHQPGKGWLAWKFQDQTFRGLPDSLCLANGNAALIEVKYEPMMPHDPGKLMFIEQSIKPKGKGLSVEQRNNLEEWQNCGGWSYVFFGVFRTGYLLSLEMVLKPGCTLDYLHEAATLVCPGYSFFDQVMVHLEGKQRANVHW